MEAEEQKPKDLLEKEIKEESEYFFEEVKKEPLDNEYFEQNVPKLKVDEPCSTSTSQMTHFVQQDPKLEENVLYRENSHVNDFSQNTQKRIFIQDFAAQNSTQTDFRIPILIPNIKKDFEINQKPFQIGVMSDQRFDFSSSWKQNISAGDPVQTITQIPASYQNAAQSSNTTMDHGKLKLIDDGNDDILKRKIPNINVSRNRNRAEHLSNNYDGQRCHMCLEKKNRLDMKYVTMEEDKLIIMIGCLLRKDCTLDQAKRFMSRKWSYICHSHFSDAIDTICEALHIKNYEDIDGSSDVLMQNLMSTVNILRPQIRYWEFRAILQKFVVTNLENRISVRTRTPVREPYEYRCSVCSQILNCNRVKSVTLENDKLVIIIGCALRGGCNPDHAQLLVSENTRMFICPDHFYEAVNEIYKRLNIQNPEEIYSCSDELMRNVMATVNYICPQIVSSTSQFCRIVLGFVRRNFISKIEKKTVRCLTCTKMINRSHTKHVTVKNEILIIMIGYILRGHFTIEEAKRFLSEKKPYLMICHSHLVEVNNEFYKILQITKPEEMLSCSSELIESVMFIVNAINPDITFLSFQQYLHKFAVRNKKYQSIMV